MKTDPLAEGRTRNVAQDCLLGLAVAGGIAGAICWRQHDLIVLGCLLAAMVSLVAWLVTRHMDHVAKQLGQGPKERRQARLQSIEEEERSMRMEEIFRRHPRLPKKPPADNPPAT